MRAARSDYPGLFDYMQSLAPLDQNGRPTETSDEGYVALKTAVVTSIRESSHFMSRTAGMLIDRHLLEREAPQMVRLIAFVADRLGVVVTEKELGLLIPIAGALVQVQNGSYTAACVWAGTSTLVGVVLVVLSRVSETGWVLRVKK